MTRIRTQSEIHAQGTRALVRALGYVDAVRFIRSFRQGKDDYSRARDRMLKNLTADNVLAAVRSAQSEQPRRRPRRKSA